MYVRTYVRMHQHVVIRCVAPFCTHRTLADSAGKVGPIIVFFGKDSVAAFEYLPGGVLQKARVRTYVRTYVHTERTYARIYVRMYVRTYVRTYVCMAKSCTYGRYVR